MKCPQCVIENETSSCFASNLVTSTAMGGQKRYWDEKDVYHSHDPNRSTSSYHCSRGHRWTVTSRHRCPGCDFGHADPEVKKGE
jgi:hypothetical protein